MKTKLNKKSIGIFLSLGLITIISLGLTNARKSMGKREISTEQVLSTQHILANDTAKCGDGKMKEHKTVKKDAKNKCGNGKNKDKNKKASKCGEGKCGDGKVKKTKTSKKEKKSKEQKCGTGKCGKA